MSVSMSADAWILKTLPCWIGVIFEQEKGNVDLEEEKEKNFLGVFGCLEYERLKAMVKGDEKSARMHLRLHF